MSKMSKIDQIHIRAVMLCMSKTSKMGKEHTHTFWLITSLILNGFSIRKKFWKAETESFPTYHQILCMSKHVEDIKTSHNRCILKYVEDVEDRSNTHKGCNAMYVEDVKDIKTSHNRCILKYVEDVKDRSNTHKGCNAMYVKDVKDIKTSHNRCLLKYVEDEDVE